MYGFLSLPAHVKFERRLNEVIFDGSLPADMDISWNARLKTTAGLTHYKRKLVDGADRCVQGGPDRQPVLMLWNPAPEGYTNCSALRHR